MASAAMIAVLFLFTLAQAVHSHASVPGGKGRHSLLAGLGPGASEQDQCPLCVGGVGSFLPGSEAPTLALAELHLTPVSLVYECVKARRLCFALSSRPPPFLLT